MPLHEKLLERADELRELAKTVSDIDDEVRAIVSKIDKHKCETASEFDEFLAEIREEVASLQGKLYKLSLIHI